MFFSKQWRDQYFCFDCDQSSRRARGTIRMSGRELRFGEEIAIGGGSVGIPDPNVAEEAKRRGCDTSHAWWGSPELVDRSVLRRPVRVNPPPPVPPVRKE
ncbi:MAG TPA: hypothetical protein VF727_14580 [Allosphingosinicella sp.]